MLLLDIHNGPTPSRRVSHSLAYTPSPSGPFGEKIQVQRQISVSINYTLLYDWMSKLVCLLGTGRPFGTYIPIPWRLGQPQR